jgi:hypothetical protein
LAASVQNVRHAAHGAVERGKASAQVERKDGLHVGCVVGPLALHGDAVEVFKPGSDVGEQVRDCLFHAAFTSANTRYTLDRAIPSREAISEAARPDW